VIAAIAFVGFSGDAIDDLKSTIPVLGGLLVGLPSGRLRPRPRRSYQFDRAAPVLRRHGGAECVTFVNSDTTLVTWRDCKRGEQGVLRCCADIRQLKAQNSGCRTAGNAGRCPMGRKSVRGYSGSHS
jgi:hypothetical protein